MILENVGIIYKMMAAIRTRKELPMEVVILLVSVLGACFSDLDFATLHFYISLAFALYKSIKRFTNEKLCCSKKHIR